MSVAPEDRTTLPSRPYLATLGPVGLRFAEALPPTDLSVRSPVVAPPPPASDPEPAPAPKPETVANEEASPPAVPVPGSAPAVAAKPPESNVPSILPDETRPKVRPEDFLPFFQFPATGGNSARGTVVSPGTLTPPAPPTQPLSTATYQQQ